MREFRRHLLHATGLGSHAPDAPTLLENLGCIQLDPIDRYGTSAELTARARLVGPVDLHAALANRSFEHFAKERCILSPRFFPWYRGKAVQTPWWRHDERAARIPTQMLKEVQAEVAERGPVRADALSERGRVDALDWSGWKGTSKLSSLALELLWTRCEVVVAARDSAGRRLYDLPERALPSTAFVNVEGDFGEEMVVERVRSAGLLSTAGGAHWSMLSEYRCNGTVERLLKQGRLAKREIGRRSFLSLPDLKSGELAEGEMRVLAPLDPLLWDRKLIQLLFDFDYVWEIYKPEKERRWGYYVSPLLRGERLVGRLEARRNGEVLEVMGLWWESHATPQDKEALDPCLERLAHANHCSRWQR